MDARAGSLGGAGVRWVGLLLLLGGIIGFGHPQYIEGDQVQHCAMQAFQFWNLVD